MFIETANYTVPLTRDLANEYATKLAWPGDRDLRPGHVAWLRREFDADKFYGPTWVKARLGDRWYRVDGKHSSTMLADLNGAFPANLKVNIREFACESWQDVVALYDTFNPRESARDGNAYAKAVMAFHTEFCDGVAMRKDAPTSAQAFKLASGIGIYLNPDSGKSLKPRDRSLLINESPEYIIDAARYAMNKLCRTGVCAALYATWSPKSTAWRQFWDEVFEDSNPDNTSPTRVLSRLLREMAASSTTGHPYKMEVRALYVKCLHAWNAYRSGTKTILHYYANKPIPEIRR